MDTIYFIRATKEYSKEDVRTLLCRQFGEDSIDRLLSIDAIEINKRVFVVALWRVPSVNRFHESYKQPDCLDLPWHLERIDPYAIFKDGHFPAPHFLRNSMNLSDIELNELGIGGPGEYIYVNLPQNEGCDNHWEMYRDGIYYMPDMTYYDQPRLEPLGSIDRPPCIRPGLKSFANANKIQNYYRGSGFNIDYPETWPNDLTEDERAELEKEREQLKSDTLKANTTRPMFDRWRDFYLEHPKTWPKDLSEKERQHLEYRLAAEPNISHWTPECGRDPTNMAEDQERCKLYPKLPMRAFTEPCYRDVIDNVDSVSESLSELWLCKDTERSVWGYSPREELFEMPSEICFEASGLTRQPSVAIDHNEQELQPIQIYRKFD